MDKEFFLLLIEKYINNQSTEAEKKIIDDFFATYEYQTSHQKFPNVSDEMWENIRNKVSLKEDTMPSTRKRKSLTMLRRPMVAALASTFIMIFVALRIYWYYAKPPEMVTISANAGLKSLLTLPDGSSIILNSKSKITYPKEFAKDKREVFLHGEAFFEVKKDQNKPFMVNTEKLQTKVLGTSFNIQSYPGERAKVTVITGKVKVMAISENSFSETILTPGKQAVFHNQIGVLVSDVETEKVIAWKNNIIRFDNSTLEEASEILSRWYGVSIEFDNDKIRNCKITGSYKNQSLENVLESLSYINQIEFKFIKSKKILLYGKGCNE